MYTHAAVTKSFSELKVLLQHSSFVDFIWLL